LSYGWQIRSTFCLYSVLFWIDSDYWHLIATGFLSILALPGLLGQEFLGFIHFLVSSLKLGNSSYHHLYGTTDHLLSLVSKSNLLLLNLTSWSYVWIYIS
jgi:hypothetical protein